MLETCRVEVFPSDEEDAPVIVWIPGAACGPRSLEPLTDRIAAEHHVITPAGFAGVKERNERDVIERTVEDLLNYIIPMRPRPALIGHSLGGMIAMAVATQIRTGPIVSIDGPPYLGALIEAQGLDLEEAATTRADAIRDRFTGLGRALRVMFRDPASAEYVISEAMQSNPETVARAMGEAWRLDQRRSLDDLSAPLLVLTPDWEELGERPRDIMRGIYAAQIDERGEHVMVPDARHFLMWDDPERCAAEITRFLDASR